MRLKLSSLLAAASMLCGQAFAAPALPAHADIRDSGFVYCVSGQVNTFNPQKVSSGLIVDTLAAQLYDRLLDVDPYTYRLVPELAESWEVLDNGATYRFHLRNIPSIGSLRCSMPLHVDNIRGLIGRGVRAEGFYETDRSGRPRLMQVEQITPYQTQAELK